MAFVNSTGVRHDSKLDLIKTDSKFDSSGSQIFYTRPQLLQTFAVAAVAGAKLRGEVSARFSSFCTLDRATFDIRTGGTGIRLTPQRGK